MSVCAVGSRSSQVLGVADDLDRLLVAPASASAMSNVNRHAAADVDVAIERLESLRLDARRDTGSAAGC